MIRNICDGCGEVMGKPVNPDSEWYDAALFIDGEMVLGYEDLCEACRKRLTANLKDLLRPKAEKPAPRALEDRQKDAIVHPVLIVEKPSEAPESDSKTPFAVEATASTPEPFQEVDKDALPNQVTRQYPIKLNIPAHIQEG